MAASTGSVVLEILHVLASTLLVGYLIMLPVWKRAVAKGGDQGALVAFFATSRFMEQRVVLGALGVILLTGAGLGFGPYAVVDVRLARWAQVSFLLTIVLGYIVWSGLGGPTKKMQELVSRGEGTGPAMDKLWGEWRTALAACAVLSAVALAFMVYQGSR